MLNISVAIETIGNLMLLVTMIYFVAKSQTARAVTGLLPGMVTLGYFALTNIFYSGAYLWSQNGWGNWYDTGIEEWFRATQILSVIIIPVCLVLSVSSILTGVKRASHRK